MRPRPLSLSCRVSKRCRIAMCTQFIFVLLPARSETATAANPVIRCRCGMPFSAAPVQHAFRTALSFAPLPQRQQIPQFGAVAASLLLRPSACGPFRAGRYRLKWHFATTFSFSLSADPRQRWLSVARHRFPAEKVPVKSLFRRHLLEFVISWSATEVALGGPAPVSCGEGAG